MVFHHPDSSLDALESKVGFQPAVHVGVLAFCGGLPLPYRLALERHRTEETEDTEGMGGDVVRRGQAGSPGSDGASPYLRRDFPREPVKLPL
jgi:hypothetical protein